jgi:phospholipid-binding lipoprotein MlaA
MQRFCSLLLVFLLGLSAGGCATTSSPDNDPLEGYNRVMTKVNLQLDDKLLVPVAKGYRKVTPEPVRNGIRNFFRNLREPYTMLNDLLQGKFMEAGQDAGRFMINTILGFAGLNDVATHMGIMRRNEDFGQTLAVWGVPPGPHLVLPLYGPSNFRDGVGLVPDFAYSEKIGLRDSTAQLGLNIMRIVDTRTRLLGSEELLELQPDPYLFLRETYRQRRALEIGDGRVPEAQMTEEELLDELLRDE